jgi:hypothetical protein
MVDIDMMKEGSHNIYFATYSLLDGYIEPFSDFHMRRTIYLKGQKLMLPARVAELDPAQVAPIPEPSRLRVRSVVLAGVPAVADRVVAEPSQERDFNDPKDERQDDVEEGGRSPDEGHEDVLHGTSPIMSVPTLSASAAFSTASA